MEKLFCIFIVCLSLFYSHHAIARNAQAAFYLGLEPQISTLDDTFRILGTPISKRDNKIFIICKYRVAEIAIDKKTKKIGIIIIYDPSFKDVNGLMIGDSYDKVSTLLNDTGKGDAIYDIKKKVTYIFNQENVVEEIVYGSLSK